MSLIVDVVTTETIIDVSVPDQTIDVVISDGAVDVIGTLEAGPQGPPGEQGPEGPQGPTGGSYRHVQSIPAAVWTVTHNLGYRPGGIYVEDSGHTPIIGRVAHIDSNTLTISFYVAGVLAAVGGEADIS